MYSGTGVNAALPNLVESREAEKPHQRIRQRRQMCLVDDRNGRRRIGEQQSRSCHSIATCTAALCGRRSPGEASRRL
jgi:hypothetical protein